MIPFGSIGAFSPVLWLTELGGEREVSQKRFDFEALCGNCHEIEPFLSEKSSTVSFVRKWFLIDFFGSSKQCGTFLKNGKKKMPEKSRTCRHKRRLKVNAPVLFALSAFFAKQNVICVIFYENNVFYHKSVLIFRPSKNFKNPSYCLLRSRNLWQQRFDDEFLQYCRTRG